MDNNYFTVLQNAGIRPSVQRLAIYEYLCSMKNHPTADTVYKALVKDYPTLSCTTIYNTLKLFEEKNIVQSIQIEDESVRYDYDTKEHLHFKCRSCQNVFDIYLPKDSSYDAQIKKLIPDNFQSIKIQTNIWGICSDCQKKSQ